MHYTKSDFIFFWGHHPKEEGVIDKSCLSNFYPSPFMLEKITFPTNEHFYMYRKARFFRDDETASKILFAETPRDAKNLGRSVKDFDPVKWKKVCINEMRVGLEAKFQQNPQLKDYLIGTGRRILVEASPYDTVWGNGLEADHPDAINPDRWPGKNALGKCLEFTRNYLDFISQ